MTSIYQSPAIPSCPVPGLYPDLAMPPRWAHLAQRPGLFVCLAQSMTPCRGDGKVVAAPDLTSHPSFCLMPGHWGCDDWITHIYPQLDKWAWVFQHIYIHTHMKKNTLTHTVMQTLRCLICLYLLLSLCYIFQLFDGYRRCSQHLLFFVWEANNKQGFHNKEISISKRYLYLMSKWKFT